ncbi:MAG: LTA synthase family protein [Synergistaceae bacterium]|nr:LTA synthase family protein [Synergistaceae bacterium]
MGFSEQRLYYAKKDNDRRELIFFLLLFAVIFIKFYFLEYKISMQVTRYPASAASSAGIVICLTVAVSLFWRKVRAFSALTVDFLISLLAVTDLLHLRYYSDMFTFMNIGLSAQVGEIADSVVALIHPSDFLYFADIPLLIFYIYISRKFRSVPFFKKVGIKRFLVSLLLIIVGVLPVGYRFWSYEKRMPAVLSSMWDRPAVSNNIGVLTYHLADVKNAAGHFLFREKLSDAQISEVKNFINEKKRGRSPGYLNGFAKGKNLIIIQVESLQQFVIDLRINGVEVTPNLNRFVRESAYFSGIYSQTALGNSSDAEFMVNTGLYPSASGVAYTRFAGNRYEALPKVLADIGYVSLALHGDRPGFWNRHRMYPSMGFSRFISKKDFIVDENIGMGLSDASFFRQSLDILDKTQKPFYAFLITLTSHYPYNFDEIFEETKLNTSPFEGTLMGNYLTSMKYFDDKFGSFIEGLRKNGLLDTSVIALYGDHPAIPSWDRSNLEKLLGRSLKNDWEWKYVQRIPLMIKIPGIHYPSEDNKETAGLIDLPETFADLMGFEFKAGFGTSLFGKDRSEPVIFRNGSFLMGKVFIEPSSRSAREMPEGKVLDYGKYAPMAEEVKKRLRYSDMILEHDLVPVIVGED